MTPTNTTERDALLEAAETMLRALDSFHDPDAHYIEVQRHAVATFRKAVNKARRTANASEASEHTAAVSSGEGVEHKKAIWVVCYPYVGGVKIYGAFDNAHDAEKLRSSKETGKRAEVHTSWLTYAPPPSDRAAVEGVTISVDIAKRAVRAMELCECESSGWLKYAEPIKAAIGATIIAERARASDTNDAAAPVGQAVEPNGYAYRYPSHYEGATVIRFNGGEEVNGSKPLEAIPYYFGAPPTPRAAYRQPTSNDAFKICDEYEQIPFGDAEVQHMLAALNSIHAVIAEEVPK